MENIQLVTPQQEFRSFMAMPDGLLKNITYQNTISGRTFCEASICKKDDHIYYSCNNFKVVKSTKSSYYIKRCSKDGFTINPKGKISIWYNKSIFQIPYINEVFKYFNFNWLSPYLGLFITKGIFEKMVAGKITNNLDVSKAYLKAMRINASPSLFLKLFLTSTVSKQDFLRQASVAKDVNHLIEYLLSPREYPKGNIIDDMIREAQILERKIDFTWSVNRLKEEHKAWTQEIMQVEIDGLDDKVISSVERFAKYTPEGFKLLRTQKEIFYEGKTMRHCLYTAYWSSIKQNNYIAYHVTLGDEDATLGIHVDKDGITYNQCYGRYNQPTSNELLILVKEFVDNLNEQVKRDQLLKIPVEEYTSTDTKTIVNELPF